MKLISTLFLELHNVGVKVRTQEKQNYHQNLLINYALNTL